jgi:hypothetical protein
MHPDSMRGKKFVAPFLYAAGLAQNEPDIYMPGFLGLFIKGMEPESLGDAFNQGFIFGLAYRHSKTDQANDKKGSEPTSA